MSMIVGFTTLPHEAIHSRNMRKFSVEFVREALNSVDYRVYIFNSYTLGFLY